MPFLDVSDVLLDPDFATTFTVTRSAAAAGADGNNVVTPSAPISVTGVVEPANSNDLRRLPDAESLTGTIAIYTPFALNVLSANTTADIVTWNGRQYTVIDVEDWSQFGAGYVRALARMLSLQ